MAVCVCACVCFPWLGFGCAGKGARPVCRRAGPVWGHATRPAAGSCLGGRVPACLVAWPSPALATHGRALPRRRPLHSLAFFCATPQDELSGADIKAMCTEAGLLALRERRMCVKQEDLKKAKEKVLYKKKEGVPEGLYM